MHAAPDILIGSHDWIGILETADLLAPVPEDIVGPGVSHCYLTCQKVVTFGDEVYKASLMMECVVMARNTELCPTKWETLSHLIEIAIEYQRDH